MAQARRSYGVARRSAWRGELTLHRWQANPPLSIKLIEIHPECCGTVYVRTASTQRPLNRQYAALAAAQGYRIVSTDPFDRLTDIDAKVNAGNRIGGASLKVKWDLGREGRVYVGFDGNHRSNFSSNPSPSACTWVAGYSLNNFRLGFRTEGGFDIYGWVRNAFDADYFEALNVPGGNTGLVTGNTGDPRTWGATIKVEF